MQAAPFGLALISSMLILAAAGSAARANEAGSAPAAACAEDATEPPTISRRFDLQPGDGAVSFRDARATAVDWCAQQTCTVGGGKTMRTAEPYALGQMRRRYVVGFRCVPAAARPSDIAPILVPIAEASAIDEARAEANERCSTIGVAGLEDIVRDNGRLVATFACGRR